jgi:1-acyl-sn-glycerol-3-phosphate acyltransferase
MPETGGRGVLEMRVVISVYAWTVGMLTVVILLVTCILLSYFLPPRRLDRFVKAGCRFLLRVLFIRVRLEGAETVDRESIHLFMANHASLFDVPVLAGYIPSFVRAVEADSHFSWPVYGWAIRRLGNIPIKRKDVHSSVRSIRKAEDWIKDGKSLVILPEGTRTMDGKLRPFKKLPFFLAKQSGVGIIPIGLSGLFRLKSKRSWMIQPTTVTVKFGPSISSETIQALSGEELMERVRADIEKLIERP